MKLRNLLFGTMIACAFAACSNEDDPIPDVNPTPETGTASLIISSEATGVTRTKTATDNSEVTSLTVALFGSDGKCKYLATRTANAPDATAEVDASDDVKFNDIAAATYTIMAFANMPSSFTVAVGNDLSTLCSTAIPLEGNIYTITGETVATATTFPMSSNGKDKITLEAGKNYFYGYSSAEVAASPLTDKVSVSEGSPVKLYRNVAKVHLMDITMNALSKYASGSATITVKKYFMVNAAQTTKVGDPTGNYVNNSWGSIQILATAANPYFAGTWYKANGTTLFSGDDMTSLITSTNAASQTKAYYMVDVEDYTLTQTAATTPVSKQLGEITTPLCSFLVFENHGTFSTETAAVKPTILSIGAKFEIDAVGTDGSKYKYTREEAYYPVQVGISGLTTGIKNGVHRNVEYKIYVTIVGDGRLVPTDPDPETTDLFVKTEVVAWGSITQNVSGE
ncbi:fimbrial protein [Parabacteroides distasonis]|uniref:fimbrial protein n=2 Tax=Parabacteroides distasonis TaxID=823 RepID=UPI00321B2F42